VVSVIENVVIVHDPRHIGDSSVTAKDTSSLMQVLSSQAAAGHEAGGISRLLTSSTASFFDFDRCILSMPQETMMTMPVMRSSDFLPLPPAGSGSQEEVYACTGRPAVRCALQGINSCVFACGQTGSGKTYTLFGEPSNLSVHPGVIPQAVEDLFATLAAMQLNPPPATGASSGDEWAFSFAVSVAFFEIYQDDIRCLISRRGPLKLNYTDSQVSIQDLEIVPVQT
jgi:hypothetical protein